MRVNYVAALVSGIVYFVIQALWFTVFSGPWIAGLGWTPERVADAKAHAAPWPYVVAFIFNVIMALVLAKVMVGMNRVSAKCGAGLGAMLWLGLVLASMATEYGFEQKPASFTLISSGAVLVGLVVMGAIQGAWISRGARKAAAVSA
jgi:hypothetical protein